MHFVTWTELYKNYIYFYISFPDVKNGQLGKITKAKDKLNKK